MALIGVDGQAIGRFFEVGDSFTQSELDTVVLVVFFDDVGEFGVKVLRHHTVLSIDQSHVMTGLGVGLGEFSTDVTGPDDRDALGLLSVFKEDLSVVPVLAELDLVAVDARNLRNNWPGPGSHD